MHRILSSSSIAASCCAAAHWQRRPMTTSVWLSSARRFWQKLPLEILSPLLLNTFAFARNCPEPVMATDVQPLVVTQCHLPLVSISVPVLNEAANVDALYERLCALGERMADRCRLEFVFTDNHSTDATWSKLSNLAAQDPRIKAIRFSKNFGFQRSILANYLHAQGDAVMQIDADLQDPPELLEQFFEQWRQGHHVVYEIQQKQQEGKLINAFRRIGYRVIAIVSDFLILCVVGVF